MAVSLFTSVTAYSYNTSVAVYRSFLIYFNDSLLSLYISGGLLLLYFNNSLLLFSDSLLLLYFSESLKHI